MIAQVMNLYEITQGMHAEHYESPELDPRDTTS
jgi:hypothetical protein